MYFVGFDGKSYSFSNVPSEIFNYDHFIIYHDTTYTDQFMFLCFNGNSFVCNNGVLSFDNGCNIAEYMHMAGAFRSPTVCTAPLWLAERYQFIYSSADMIEYADILATREFSLDLTPVEIPEVPVSSYVLRPIIEEQENIPDDIFSEMFGILPVLLVVLVGFISIRKAIAWLSSILRKS